MLTASKWQSQDLNFGLTGKKNPTTIHTLSIILPFFFPPIINVSPIVYQ